MRFRTGDTFGAGQYAHDPLLEITTSGGKVYSGRITGYKERDAYSTRSLSVGTDIDTHGGPDCFTCSQIASVALRAGGNDGWYVESVATYLGNPGKPYVKLTCDPDFKKWIDGNGPRSHSYRLLSLFDSMPAHHHCIRQLKIEVMTASGGNNPGWASWSWMMRGKKHKFGVVLKDGTVLTANLNNSPLGGDPLCMELNLEEDFGAWCACVKRSDIEQVKLKAGGSDGWHVSSIKTHYLTEETGAYEELTDDPYLHKWLDSDDEDEYGYNAEEIVLSLSPFKDTPTCGYGIPVCKCAEGATTCTFNLAIEEIMTFTSYQKFGVGVSEGLFVRGREGVLYYINETTGERTPHPAHASRKCAKDYSRHECSGPQFVDGKTFRLAIAVNGRIPAPTLVVHEGQKVIIHVHNNLTTEGISIHWHGMFQMGSPWMDGVGQVTQCQIGPSSSFSYMYLARPSGTFWYHSHSGGQRTDGFFGALVVKETPQHHQAIVTELAKYRVGDFLDLPGEHTLSFLDWQRDSSLETFVKSNGGLGFFPDLEVGEVPPPTATPYTITFGYEGVGVGPTPYFSGLINGKGRHDDVPYSKTRLSVFTVEEGKRYRFRLVGAQGVYPYKFSIDGHKLIVVGADGFWTEPVKEVDYIVVHTGERYDFFLEANALFGNYWLRAETLEIFLGSSPPYQTQGHVAEGILQYKSLHGVAPVIKSTDYEAIKLNSPVRECSATETCKMVNCPFENFHPAYYTECVNVHQLRLLIPTPPQEMPASTPCPEEGCRHFLNFNFEGNSRRSSINGRNFLLPPAPPQTQNDAFHEQAIICDKEEFCNPSTLGCLCTHMITIPYMKTIQLVFTAQGEFDAFHPIHLHGHTFHVAKVGYPEYDPATGFIKKKTVIIDGEEKQVSVHNPDIFCDDQTICTVPGANCDQSKCTKPRWANMANPPNTTIDDRTIRKDTVMVPAGGYVAINFISDNPGYWFLHCHIEDHQMQGMALIMNEAPEEQRKFDIPENFNKCGDFTLSMEEYMMLRLPHGMSAFQQGRGNFV